MIASGARAAAPPISGLDTVDYLTNETLFSLTELPHGLALLEAAQLARKWLNRLPDLAARCFC